MSTFTLEVPEEIFLLARQIAEDASVSAEQVLLEHLKTLTAPLSGLPPDEQAELSALQHLSNDALRTIAREQMPQDVQDRMQILMDKNSLGTISSEEYQELADYVERGNRLMVRKAEAAGILLDRGYSFVQDAFTQQ